MSTTNIAISYSLSEAGRRASILAGGDGKSNQTVYAPACLELLGVASVAISGEATVQLRAKGAYAQLDAPLSAEDAAAMALAEAAADKAAAVAKRIADTLAWREAARSYLSSPTTTTYFESHGNIGLHPAGYASETDCTPEELAAVKAEHTRRVQAERDTNTAQLRAELPRWMAGEISGFSSAPSTSGLSDGEKVMIAAEYERREQKAKTDKLAAEKAKIDERDAWIRAHGSPRLVKGLELGQLKAMGSVYRDERIAHDLGSEWIAWGAAPEPDDNDLLNPSESALDALAAAKTKWPKSDSRLCSVGGMDKRGYDHDWRPALMIDGPWDASVTAIMYVDESGDARARKAGVVKGCF
jgi:hypothetical protein